MKKKRNKPSRDGSPGIMLPAVDLTAITARTAAGFRAQSSLASMGLALIEKIKAGEYGEHDDDCPDEIRELKDNPAAIGALNALGHLFAAAGMIAAKIGDDAVAFDQAVRASLKAGDAIEADLPRTGRQLFDLLPGAGDPGKAAEALCEGIDEDKPEGTASIALLMKPWKEIAAKGLEHGGTEFQIDGEGNVKLKGKVSGSKKPEAKPEAKAAPEAPPAPPKWNGDRWRTGEDAGDDWNPDGTRN